MNNATFFLMELPYLNNQSLFNIFIIIIVIIIFLIYLAMIEPVDRQQR